MSTPYVEIDGRAATAAELHSRALVNYGHFTTMQIRAGRVRGLERHLARLDTATFELFQRPLDGDHVRELVRHALDAHGTADASVRIDVFEPAGTDAAARTMTDTSAQTTSGSAVSVMVTVRPPADVPDRPLRLMWVPYLRPIAHIKHAGTFGQIYHGRAAERAGYDDALLTGPSGLVAETTVANIGFFDGSEVVWPKAPILHGITMQLLQARFLAARVACRTEEVWLADVPSFATTFVINSAGVSVVDHLEIDLPVDKEFLRLLTQTYDSVPWDQV